MSAKMFSFKEYYSIDNFKLWFGDSKITKDNKPMVLYHGSDFDNIAIFDINKVSLNSGNYGHYGNGFYFTNNLSEAKLYGKFIYECYLKIENPFLSSDEDYLKLKSMGWNVGDYKITKVTLESFINQCDNDTKTFFKNIRDKGSDYAWSKVPIDSDIDFNLLYDLIIDNEPEYLRYDEYIFNELNININNLVSISEFTYKTPLHYITDTGLYGTDLTTDLIKLGYDGVVFGSEYVVFNSYQIKSINNDGSYDPNNPNIYK